MDFERRRRDAIWELVGLRIEGAQEPLLGAIRFQRQADGSRARRSLASYLSSPPRDMDPTTGRLPSSMIRVASKPRETSFPAFLKSLHEGRAHRIVAFDARSIRAAFDFRADNPSRERERFRVRSLERMLFRSREGHVLEGNVHAWDHRREGVERFVGLGSVRQLTPSGAIVLPNLIVHRDFLAAATPWSQDALEDSFFEPDASAGAPLVGRAAWRYFSAREEREEEAESGSGWQPGSVASR